MHACVHAVFFLLQAIAAPHVHPRFSHGMYHTIALQNAEDLVSCETTQSAPATAAFDDLFHIHTSHDLHLRNAMTIPQHDAYLTRRGALLRELADLVDDCVRGGFEPGGWGAGVGDRGGADALAVAVKATHFGGVGCWW